MEAPKIRCHFRKEFCKTGWNGTVFDVEPKEGVPMPLEERTKEAGRELGNVLLVDDQFLAKLKSVHQRLGLLLHCLLADGAGNLEISNAAKRSALRVKHGILLGEMAQVERHAMKRVFCNDFVPCFTDK